MGGGRPLPHIFVFRFRSHVPQGASSCSSACPRYLPLVPSFPLPVLLLHALSFLARALEASVAALATLVSRYLMHAPFLADQATNASCASPPKVGSMRCASNTG